MANTVTEDEQSAQAGNGSSSSGQRSFEKRQSATPTDRSLKAAVRAR